VAHTFCAAETRLRGSGGRTRTGESVRVLSNWNRVITSPECVKPFQSVRRPCKAWPDLCWTGRASIGAASIHRGTQAAQQTALKLGSGP
jgi:hypothetical protein